MKKLLTAMIVSIFYIALPAWGYNAAHFFKLGMDSNLANTKINYFSRAIELNPALSAAYKEQGMLYYYQGHYSKTIHNFLRATQLSPDDANGFTMLGVAYFKNNNYPSAVSNLTRAIELNPKNAKAYGYRAETYRRMGMLDFAVKDATRAIKISGNNRIIGKAYSTRAKAYKALGDKELAEADLKKAVNLDPAYDIYKMFTTTEFLADSAGRSGSVKGIGWIGAVGLIAIAFVLIFKLTLQPPRKDDKDI